MMGITSAAVAMAADERPNILWLTYEDTSPNFIGCYGDSAAKTPNIDALAKNGVRFDAAFSTGSVSSPSRFCLITGVKAFSSGNGHHRSSYPIPSGWEGFPYYLRQAGYYTANNSKTDYNLADAKQFTDRAWNESSSKADWRARENGQPFFVVYNSMSSHQSRTMTDPWGAYEKNVLSQLTQSEKTPWGNLQMPDFYLNSEQMQKHFSRVYNSITKTDKEFGQWLKKLDDDNLRESTIIFCFSDHGEGIPRGKCSPTGLGHRVPFIVWIPQKYAHLSPYGSGIITDEIVSFEDLGPTILSLAGVVAPKHMEGKPFMGKLRAEPKKYFFGGVDRCDGNTDMSREVSDGKYLYVRSFMPYQPLMKWIMYFDTSDIQQQIRADYKESKLNHIQSSILEPRESEYLFDLKNDPWEVVNLANDSRYQDKMEEFRKVLRDNLIRSRDAGFIPENKIITEARKGVAPYDLRLNRAVLPIDEVVKTALLVGQGTKVVNKQISALYDPNEIVQYWAAVGLFSQTESLEKQTKAIAEAYSNVKYSMAKIYLAATLIERCGEYKYLTGFLKGIGHPYPEVERTTAQVIMAMDVNVQRSALPFIEKRMLDNAVPASAKNWYAMILNNVKGYPLNEITSDF